MSCTTQFRLGVFTPFTLSAINFHATNFSTRREASELKKAIRTMDKPWLQCILNFLRGIPHDRREWGGGIHFSQRISDLCDS